MAYNLFIAYDLMKPGQNYDAVIKQIRSLGQSYQFQLSLFYVHTNMSPGEAFSYIWTVMDGNDRLAVINCADAFVTNWDHPPIDAINTIWAAH